MSQWPIGRCESVCSFLLCSSKDKQGHTKTGRSCSTQAWRNATGRVTDLFSMTVAFYITN